MWLGCWLTFCDLFLLKIILLISYNPQWNILIWWSKLRWSHNIQRNLLIWRIIWTVWRLDLPAIYLRFLPFLKSTEHWSILIALREAILCSIKLIKWRRRGRICDLTYSTREGSIEEMHYLVSCIVIGEFKVFLDWSSYLQSDIGTC